MLCDLSGNVNVLCGCCAHCPGKDALIVMHTGGGKSMCYIIPALMAAGLALVVSPLIGELGTFSKLV